MDREVEWNHVHAAQNQMEIQYQWEQVSAVKTVAIHGDYYLVRASVREVSCLLLCYSKCTQEYGIICTARPCVTSKQAN